MQRYDVMSKQVTLGEQFQKHTFEALALQVLGGHFLIFIYKFRYLVTLEISLYTQQKSTVYKQRRQADYEFS